MKYIQPTVTAICMMAGFFTLYLAARSLGILLSSETAPAGPLTAAALIAASLSGLSFFGAYKAPPIVKQKLGYPQ